MVYYSWNWVLNCMECMKECVCFVNFIGWYLGEIIVFSLFKYIVGR